MGTIFPDIPRIYTALAEWLACMLYVSFFPSRFEKWKYALLIVITGVAQALLQIIAGQLPLIVWIPGMLMNIAWMLITIALLAKVNLKEVLFIGTKAFIVAEMIAAIAWQLYCYWLLNTDFNSSVSRVTLMSIQYTILLAIIFWIEKSSQKIQLDKILHRKEVIISILTGLIIFAVGNIGFLMTGSNTATGYDSNTIFIIRSFVNFSGFLVLYTQEQHLTEQYLRNELVAIQNVFQNQYEQYRAFNENSELIHRKVHDLKHQLSYLRQESDDEKREVYLGEIETMIHNFEAKIETGNPVLDTVLTRKNQYCLQHDINFTCLVQGEVLNFMDTMDLCTLFGNAIDNAIEAVETIKDAEKRLITLKVSSKGNFTIIRLDNYFENQIQFDKSSFPTTTKANTSNHGYGLKSMEYIVEKYDGSLTFTQEEQWIQLGMLIPIPSN